MAGGLDKILSGERVDVLEPFPLVHARRVWGWTQSGGGDAERWLAQLASTDEDRYTDAVISELQSPGVRSFAVMDRTDTRRDGIVPVIGIITTTPASASSRRMHISARRKRTAHMDEAIRLVMDTLYASEPQLQRLEALIPTENRAAVMRAQRSQFVEKLPMTLMVHRRPLDDDAEGAVEE